MTHQAQDSSEQYAAGSRRPRADYAEFRAAFGQLYPAEGPMCGFELPAGWRALVWQLSEQLMPLGVVVDQVKEKFGRLRVSLTTGTVVAYQLIERAETASRTTCQVCGGPGEERKIGIWMWTLCTACYEERRADQALQDRP